MKRRERRRRELMDFCAWLQMQTKEAGSPGRFPYGWNSYWVDVYLGNISPVERETDLERIARYRASMHIDAIREKWGDKVADWTIEMRAEVDEKARAAGLPE